jgi:hypothetical protein
MRSYAIDSPRAAARLVALALIADGHLSRNELDALDTRDAARQLGLAPGELQEVVHGLCEDLLATRRGDWTAACAVDAQTLEALAGEVRDPALRWRVLELLLCAVASDGRVADGEAAVVRAAIARWGLADAPPKAA